MSKKDYLIDFRLTKIERDGELSTANKQRMYKMFRYWADEIDVIQPTAAQITEADLTPMHYNLPTNVVHRFDFFRGKNVMLLFFYFVFMFYCICIYK